MGTNCLLGAPKSPKNFTSTFFNTGNFLPKDLRFENGGAKLASCPECRLTSLRHCAVAYVGMAGMARAMGATSTEDAKLAWQKLKHFMYSFLKPLFCAPCQGRNKVRWRPG